MHMPVGEKLETYGLKRSGTYIAIPSEKLVETIPGWTYEILITTDKPAPPNTVNTILTQFRQKLPQVKILWIHVEGNQIRIQLQGSPIAWSLILALIGWILPLLGLTLILIAVWSVISAVPGWAWAALVTGVLLILLTPTITTMLKPPKKK
jgi:hypothetical protein